MELEVNVHTVWKRLNEERDAEYESNGMHELIALDQAIVNCLTENNWSGQAVRDRVESFLQLLARGVEQGLIEAPRYHGQTEDDVPTEVIIHSLKGGCTNKEVWEQYEAKLASR